MRWSEYIDKISGVHISFVRIHIISVDLHPLANLLNHTYAISKKQLDLYQRLRS
jgi:hypothetical protein